MDRKILGVLVAAALVGAACGTDKATTVPSTTPSAAAIATSAPPTARPSAAPPEVDQLMFGDDYQPEAGRPGGSVTVSDWQAASQLNPALPTSSADADILAATMRGLFTITPSGHWKPDLAARMPKSSDQSVRIDGDGKGVTVDLESRPGLLWSDGQALTLHDLEYTWKWALDPAQVAGTSAGWDAIDRIDVSNDGLKASVHITRPGIDYYSLLARPLLPEHWMKTIPIKDAADRAYPLGPDIARSPTSGPYKYDTASDTAVVLSRNDHWKAGDHPAYLDKITFQYQADKDELIAAFVAHQTDLALHLEPGDYDAIKAADPATGRALVVPEWSYDHLDLNQAGGGPGHGHPALQDPVVRTAIAGAIDKAALLQAVFPGAPADARTMCTNAVPTNYWRLPDDQATCPPFDVSAANAALDGAGYALGPDGIRVDPKSKLPLVFEHCSSTAGSRTVGGQFLATSLQQIGIKLNLDAVDSTTVLLAGWADVPPDTKCNLRHGNYDTAEIDSPLSTDLAADFNAYHSDQIPNDADKGQGSNTLRLKDPAMDAAVGVLRSSPAQLDRVSAAYAAQERYLADNVEIPLYAGSEVRGYPTRVRNLLWDPGRSTELWNVEDWFVAQ